MQQAGYHHANMLAQQMRTDLTNQQTEMLAMMQNLVPEQEPEVQESAPQPVANAVINDVQLQMLQILQAMQAAQLNANNRQNNGGGNNGGNTSGGNNRGNNSGGGDNNGQRPKRTPRITPDNATFTRQVKTHYYHTHRACNHQSSDCNSRAQGHRNGATLANRMGGSNAFCE